MHSATKNTPASSSPPRLLHAALALVSITATALLTACPAPTPPKPTTTTAEPTTAPAANTSISLARRQVAYVPIPITAAIAPTTLTIERPTGPASWPLATFTPFAFAPQQVHVASPLAEQLHGKQRITSDLGSYLAPAAPAKESDDSRAYTLPPTAAAYLRIEVPAALEPGTYTLPIRLRTANTDAAHSLLLQVSDIAFPTDPRVFAVATTTTAQLRDLYPHVFDAIPAQYLDRAEPDHRTGVAILDRLVRVAQREGLAFFVEDIAPPVRVDEVGRVILDWDAYDRTMGPYFDGSAFSDRIALPVWVAPTPPRRIRESPIQLRQYLQACIEHHQQKNWISTPAILHTALADPSDEDAGVQTRQQIATVLKNHVGRDVLVICTPDANLPHTPMWVVDDADPRFPPAGALADEKSVRAWPWMLATRNVKGLVWRDALSAVPGPNSPPNRALLLLQPSPKLTAEDAALLAVQPSARLAWLSAGLADANLVGLLEKRSDPALVRELLGGVAGRTGITITPPPSDLPSVPAGFLYAGWPVENADWQALPALVHRLVLASDPGLRVQLPPDDPQLLAAKMWVAQAHKPVARVAGYRFAINPGREGTVLQAQSELLLENPIGTTTRLKLSVTNLPGDSLLSGVNEFPLDPFGLHRGVIQIAGRLDSITEPPAPLAVELMENINGAIHSMPVQLPIQRTRSTTTAPKLDGRGDEWNDRRLTQLGAMLINTRYANRPDMLEGKLRRSTGENALARFTYDTDFLYAFIHVPQEKITDERNNLWPDAGHATSRWWDSDGIQLVIAGGTNITHGTRVLQIGAKPSGVVLTRTAAIHRDQPLRFEESPAGVKYAIHTDAKGYGIELAIPRKWFNTEHDADPTVPAWRINLLRHNKQDLLSTSWSGPLVNDNDLAMMGILIGSTD